MYGGRQASGFIDKKKKDQSDVPGAHIPSVFGSRWYLFSWYLEWQIIFIGIHKTRRKNNNNIQINNIILWSDRRFEYEFTSTIQWRICGSRVGKSSRPPQLIFAQWNPASYLNPAIRTYYSFERCRSIV